MVIVSTEALDSQILFAKSFFWMNVGQNGDPNDCVRFGYLWGLNGANSNTAGAPEVRRGRETESETGEGRPEERQGD